MRCHTSINKSTLVVILLLMVISELFLLGSGRLVEIGPLTFRMVLYFASLAVIVMVSIKTRMSQSVVLLLLCFVFSVLLSVLIGLMNGADMKLVSEDVKPLSYFLMVLFFSIVINSVPRVLLVAKTVKVCSVIMMAAYLLILLALFFKKIDYAWFYEKMRGTGEVFFRPDLGFFYKGFLYLCVGFIFFWFDGRKWAKIIAALLVLAIILTFTRGFLVSIAATLLIYLVFFARRNIKTLLSLALLAVFAALVVPWYLSQVGDKSKSNTIRLKTIEQVKESINPVSLVFGHGLGIGVRQRKGHMEITYLEIFHKQGIVGLAFWGVLLGIIIYRYLKIKEPGAKKMALPFMLSVILIYVQTATNPYLNNPIGMSMVLISLSVLQVIRKNDGSLAELPVSNPALPCL